MKRIYAVLVAMVMGCGGSHVDPSGTGGSMTASASTGGAGGEYATQSASSSAGTGTGAAESTVGDPKCAGTWKLTAPIFGESMTTSSPPVPIVEDGVLAALRVTPPSYPWTATSAAYSLGLALGYCVNLDHEVVAWVGPAGGEPPAHPANAVVTEVLAANHGAFKGLVPITIAFSSPVVVHEGEVLYVAVKLRALASDQRTCLRTCNGGGVDPDSYWGAIDQATGKPGDCPANDCSMIQLAESPTPAEAHAYGNDDKRIVIVVHGHS